MQVPGSSAGQGRRRKRPRVQAVPVLAAAGTAGKGVQPARARPGDGEEGGPGPESSPAANGKDSAATQATNSTPVVAPPSALFRTDTTFAKLGLARWLVEACGKLGMHHPTEIQVMCIPPVLAGKNIVGNSKTGSGKTACYCLPTLHHLSKDPYGIFELILVPVRELAFQVTDNFRALGKGIKVEVLEVVGGRDMLFQSKMMAERKHVVAATPGRLADLLRGDPDLARAFRNLRTLVLDEADRLLTPTFEESLPEILAVLPKTRQTLLFSATVTRSIEKLRSRLSTDGKELILMDANPTEESLETLTQQYVFVPAAVQICYVHYLLKEHFAEDSCIVFCSTIKLCQMLMTMLEILGFSVTGLHALQSQRRRQACLTSFRGGRSKILVATDVAGRGLDIPKVSVIVNIGLPRRTDDYVHRAGRTARAGRPGLVVSLMTEHDVSMVHDTEERIGKKLELRPTVEDDAIKLLSKTARAQQKAELLLSEAGFEERLEDYRSKQAARRPDLQKKTRKTIRKQFASTRPKSPDPQPPSEAVVEAPSKGELRVKRRKIR